MTQDSKNPIFRDEDLNLEETPGIDTVLSPSINTRRIMSVIYDKISDTPNGNEQSDTSEKPSPMKSTSEPPG